jgi:hypothetical protein
MKELIDRGRIVKGMRKLRQRECKRGPYVLPEFARCVFVTMKTGERIAYRGSQPQAT